MGAEPKDAQAEVIAFLASGRAFAGKPVERAETHTAIVFLAGDRAYKLKKQIRYSYLDYSTVALRRAQCEAECTINRRFAPALYLGTQPVTRAADGTLTRGGEGDAVDWLVVMRRFNQEEQFDRMAERHALSLEMMRPLADRIAEVHRDAEVRFEYGGAAGLRQAIDITIENLAIAATHGLDRELTEAWTKRVLAALHDLTPLLDRRRDLERVRACHGDLHLQNICLFEGRPTLFDAIEFDPSLSCTDVLYDLAFLLMDLGHRGLALHANRVFNRYLDRRAELDGLPALRLFMSVRAAIRAQIAVATAQHRHDTGHERSLLDQARSYLDLALALLEPWTPRLMAIGGVSGTGKSTLAYGLAPSLAGAPGARVLRTDMIRKRLAGVDPETPLTEEFYTPARNIQTYDHLMADARLTLAGGCPVIVDAVFARQAERDAVRAVADAQGVPFQGVWLEAPPDIVARRIGSRHGDASDATAEIALRQLEWIERPVDWRLVDAQGAPDEVARRVGMR